MKKLLITGTSGFVGEAVGEYLKVFGYKLVLPSRSRLSGFLQCDQVALEAINESTDWSVYLEGVDCVVHIAAKPHSIGLKLDELRRVNVDGTKALALQAVEAGVKQFIFISSLKVNGETGVFNTGSLPKPASDYGQSKLDAENILRSIAEETSMSVDIIRPPLVYGPKVGGNFLSLIKLAKLNLPLPFKSINNERSFIGTRNLASFINWCINNPSKKSSLHLVSDQESLSMYKLISAIRQELGVVDRQISLPSFVFKLAGKLFRKEDVVDRLIGDLKIELDPKMVWRPGYSFREDLSLTIKSLNKTGDIK